MALLEDETERAIEEECPGPTDLESAPLSQTIGDAISHPALTVETETSLSNVLRVMREEARGAVLVVRGGKLAGIFTERDVLLRIAGQAIDLDRTGVSEYMTPNPVTLPPDASVAFALNKMVMEGFRHIPLVDDQGRPTGVVSMRDAIEYLADFFPRDLLNLPPDPRLRSRDREGA